MEPYFASSALRAAKRVSSSCTRSESVVAHDVAEHAEGHRGSVNVGLEVPQVGVRPDLFLAGDLACGDLFEEGLSAIADLRGVEREVLVQ